MLLVRMHPGESRATGTLWDGEIFCDSRVMVWGGSEEGLLEAATAAGAASGAAIDDDGADVNDDGMNSGGKST